NLKVKEKNKDIKFGCYIYQDSLEYKDILRITLECEKLGYDSVWLKDNFIPWIQDYISFNSNTDNNNSSELHKQGKYQEQNQEQHYKQKPTERMMIIMAKYHLKGDITTYQIQNAIQSQSRSCIFPCGLVEVVRRL